MKKISLFLVVCFLIIIAVSCTSEDSANFSANSKDELHQKSGGSTLDSLYTEMITSERYIDLMSLRENFNQKLNYTGAFASESDMLDWIRINISSTGFADYNTAVSDWETIKAENFAVFQANIGFYNLLADEPEGSLVFYDILIGHMPETEVYEGCDCGEVYAGIIAAETAAYNSAVAKECKKLKLAQHSPENVAAELGRLHNEFIRRCDQALNEFNHCIDDCIDD